MLDAYNNDVSFDEGWYILKGHFDSLCHFVGGIASIFPGTAQAESEFLIVKTEKDDFQTSITKISLKGVLHSNQFAMIHSL